MNFIGQTKSLSDFGMHWNLSVGLSNGIFWVMRFQNPVVYILKHKISKVNSIYVCDGKHRSEHFHYIHKKQNH